VKVFVLNLPFLADKESKNDNSISINRASADSEVIPEQGNPVHQRQTVGDKGKLTDS
jgi:hypothetical protein